MRLIETAYVRLLQGLAAVAGVIMGATAVMIVFDVTVRNLGFQPPPHTLTFTEYGLLYVTMLGAPWLVRTKGHVYIELVTAAVGPRVRAVMSRLVALLCLVVCATLCYYAAGSTWIDFQRGDMDIRSYDMPRWILMACMPLGFGLMSVEFARYLLGFDSLHTGEAGIHE
ncbi:MAG: TRAP transporter small permease [Minwuiales bacterium]|nr:TRAP transporter small permease [Minwuiales bacterium]